MISALLLVSFSSCFFLGPSAKTRYKQVAVGKPLDVIIVPGLPLYQGKIDTLLKARLMWSSFLYHKKMTNHVLYSGGAVYSPWLEGSSMALAAEELGINKEHVLIDSLAEHSTENLYYGYLLAKQKGFKKIAVATDPFQCAMLYKFAKKNFKQDSICFLPIMYDSIRSQMTHALHIDTTLTKKQNFVSIKERQNYSSRLKGTRGKQIKR